MNQNPNHKPSVWQMIVSVLAAMFGVQKNKNRERDFQHGNPAQFILLGIIMVMMFVLLVFLLVKMVMQYAPSA